MATYYSPKIVTDGLVLAVDSGNIKSNGAAGITAMNNLAGTGGTPTVVNGVTSSSFVTINGTNGYIEIVGSVSSATLSPSVATFDIWFNPDSGSVFNGSANSLISRGNYNTAGGFFIHFFTNTVSSNAPSVSATFSYSTTTSYTHNATSAYALSGFNKWHHVTVSAGANLKIYINGVLKETVARNVSTIIYGNGAINTGGDTALEICSTLSYAPTLAQGSGGYWNPFKGNFGSTNMWNRILSDYEILQNYNATKSRFGLI